MLGDIKALLFVEALMLAGLFLIAKLGSRETREVIDTRFRAMVLILPATGLLMPGGQWPYAVAVVALLPILARSRAEAARLYLGALPLMPLLGFQVVLPGGLYLFQPTFPMLLTIGLGLSSLAHRRTARLGLSGTDVAVALCFLTAAIIDFRQSQFPTSSFTNYTRVALVVALSIPIPYYLLSRGLGESAALRKAAIAFLAAGLLMAVVAIFEMVRHWPLYQTMYSHLRIPMPGLSTTLRVRGGLLRSPGPFAESTSFGVYLSLVGVAATQLRGFFASRGKQVIGVAIVILALLAPSSRGAWLGLAGALLLLCFFNRRFGLAALLTGGAAVAYGGLLLIASQSLAVAEAIGVAGQGAETSDYRRDLLTRGIQTVLDHPLQGIDKGQATILLADLIQGEHIIDFVNAYIFVAVFAGIPGLIFYFLPWVSGLVTSVTVSMRKNQDRNGQEVAAWLFGSIIALIVCLSFTSLAERNQIWAPALVALSLAHARGRATRPLRQQSQPTELASAHAV